MTFFLKLTPTGLAKLAAASTGGPAVSLTQMAVGDGNGNPIVTSPLPTALAREVYRTQINSLYVNPNDSTMMIAEMLIPSNVGGWAVREIAVLDSTGAVFAIGNFPDTYKPVAAEGGTRDMIVHAAIKVSNAANVQLVIDTSIVTATRPWVIATITAAYLLPGGLTGQVLAKKSNADGDFQWVNPLAVVNVTVDAIKEIQTATASQQIFTLATLTTVGTAVYVEGSREFDFTILNGSQIQLSRTLPAGVRVMFVQNAPTEPINLRRLVVSRSYFMGQFV